MPILVTPVVFTSRLLAIAVCLVAGAAAWAADQNEAVAAITKLGGKAVVKVNLRNRPITDADLVHLKGLTKLQELRLGGTKITDRGLEHLKSPTELRTLIMEGRVRVVSCERWLRRPSWLPSNGCRGTG